MKRIQKITIALLALLVTTIAGAANPYYSHTSGVPATGSQASSSVMRAEFDSIVTGFNLLPTLSGNANLPIFVDGTGSSLVSVSAATARTNLGALAITNNLSDVANAATARTNLGLGSIATQAASSVAITGGTLSGVSSLALTGNASSTLACIAGYTRIAPNYCARDGYSTGFTALTGASGCTQTTSLGTTDAKAIAVLGYGIVVTRNSTQLNNATAFTFAGSDATCTTATGVMGGAAFEFVANAGATQMAVFPSFMIVRSNTAGQIYVKPSTIDTNSSVNVYIVGYYD